VTVFDRVVVGVDGTDFGFEALHQTLALRPPGQAVLAVTALDTAIAGYAGFQVDYYRAQLEEEAERARAKAVQIMGDRPDRTTKVVRGDAKGVLRHVCTEYDATLGALGGRSSSRFLGMMTGETASTLLHDAARSVLFARPRWGQRWHPNRIRFRVEPSGRA
jgi:nucleotide-binding universal stress UspA family protein